MGLAAGARLPAALLEPAEDTWLAEELEAGTPAEETAEDEPGAADEPETAEEATGAD